MFEIEAIIHSISLLSCFCPALYVCNWDMDFLLLGCWNRWSLWNWLHPRELERWKGNKTRTYTGSIIKQNLPEKCNSKVPIQKYLVCLNWFQCLPILTISVLTTLCRIKFWCVENELFHSPLYIEALLSYKDLFFSAIFLLFFSICNAFNILCNCNNLW